MIQLAVERRPSILVLTAADIRLSCDKAQKATKHQIFKMIQPAVVED